MKSHFDFFFFLFDNVFYDFYHFNEKREGAGEGGEMNSLIRFVFLLNCRRSIRHSTTLLQKKWV